MGRVTIHCEPQIAWQPKFAAKMQHGLKELGIKASISPSRWRDSETAILLGTTCWRNIETDGDFLLVDRCSFNDTNEWVSLVWNGHGRRGDHKVPDDRGDRWDRVGCEVKPWQKGKKVVLCGQTETYSPSYKDLHSWYSQVKATHFRKHPVGDNPTNLPLSKGWRGVGRVITLNSSVAVESVMQGVPTVTMDQAAMAWDVTSHDPDKSIRPDRQDWLEWLSWTQWHHSEIYHGLPIKHLFEEI